VVDDLRLAARADERSEEGITEGLRIILDKVAALLGEFAIEEIPAIGSPFDPRWHEALAHQPTESAPPGVVLDEFERGYRLRDLLVRPARVVVAKAPEPPAAGAE
jgi:molecular chaperone GrpE